MLRRFTEKVRQDEYETALLLGYRLNLVIYR